MSILKMIGLFFLDIIETLVAAFLHSPAEMCDGEPVPGGFVPIDQEVAKRIIAEEAARDPVSAATEAAVAEDAEAIDSPPIDWNKPRPGEGRYFRW